MKLRPRLITAAVLASASLALAQAPRIVSREVGAVPPPGHLAMYPEATGSRLIAPGSESDDDGGTWRPFMVQPNIHAGIAKGSRREMGQGVVDAANGRALFISNALDTRHLDTTKDEPEGALAEYYLRYRVSADGARTWLVDAPIIHSGAGFTEQEPFAGIKRGVNAMMSGDCGTVPLITRTGRILFPVQATVIGADGKLHDPAHTGGSGFFEVFVLIGAWQGDGRIEWRASPRVKIAPEVSTRGIFEPTLAQFDDGRLLMVMRGSNLGRPELPGRKFFSISSDDGETWSEPRAWRFDDGAEFFSPSSMSALIRHRSGRVFWFGNVSNANTSGNDPRWPLMMGEVNPQSLLLERTSLVELDSKHPDDEARGQELTGKPDAKLDLSHFWVREDRATGEFIVTCPRAFGGYKKLDWASLRVTVARSRSGTDTETK